jgi:phospholipid/cholesterol/gamma-HCH transport system ATP-binding protein
VEQRRGDGGERPLEARDWEESRGARQQETGARRPAEDVPDNILAQTREGEEPYKWHSGRTREHGGEDAVEFIDVKKSFGRNTILNGLNLGLPNDQISMVLGPSGTGKSVCI